MIGVYIGSNELPLLNPIDFGVTYQAATFQEIGVAQGSFSVQFEIVNTASVAEVLGYSTIQNSESITGISQEIAATVQNGVTVLDTGIVRIDEVEANVIRATFFGQNVDWFSKVKDTNLKDADMSYYDHDRVVASIDSNFNRTTGYTYLLTATPTIIAKSNHKFDLGEVFPAPFVKDVLRGVFKKAGYNVTGSLFQDPLFDCLLMPFNGSSWPSQADWNTQRSGTASFGFGNGFAKGNIPALAGLTRLTKTTNYCQVIGNNAGWFDSTTGILTVAENCIIELEISINSESVNNSSGSAVVSLGASVAGSYVINRTVAGSPISYPYIGGWSNDTYKAQLSMTAGQQVWLANINSNVNRPYTLSGVLKWTLIQGGTVDVASFCPDITCGDLLEWLAATHGVLATYDRVENTVRLDLLKDIELLPSEDWSGKLDVTEPPVRNFNTMLDGYAVKNNYMFSGENTDGNGHVQVDNSWLDAERDAAPDVFGFANLRYGFNGATYKLPLLDTPLDDTPLIAYSLKSTIISNLTNGNLTHVENNTTGVVQYYMTWAWMRTAAAGIVIGDVVAFGENEPSVKTAFEVSFADSVKTNLIERYLQPLYDRLLKMELVECSLRLSDIDIAQLDYRRLKYIEELGGYYYINKIIQYNGSPSTRCELVKWN
jgi:hypothetical protein